MTIDAELGRVEAPLLLLDVAAVLDRRQDRRVGRRPADALLLQLLDQRRLGEPRRRLREVLLGPDLEQLDRLALLERRQQRVAGLVLVAGVLGRLALVDRQVAGELHHLAGGAQLGAGPPSMSTVVWS